MAIPNFTQPQLESRLSRRRLWLIIAGICIVVLILFAVFVGITVYTALNTLKLTGSIPERYYLNIMGSDYTAAYSYLDSKATINGQPVGDQQTFTNLAQVADSQYGTVRGIVFNTESDATNVTVTVSRGSRSYDVHLVMKQENGSWKILTADGI